MTYSQTLGLIGYSLLPLVIVAPLVSLLKQYQWLAFFVKVTILHYRTSYIYIYIYIYDFIYFSIVRVLVCYGRHTALAHSWPRRNFDTRSLFFSIPSFYSLSIFSPSTREHSTILSRSTSLGNVFTTKSNTTIITQNFYSWSINVNIILCM